MSEEIESNRSGDLPVLRDDALGADKQQDEDEHGDAETFVEVTEERAVAGKPRAKRVRHDCSTN